MVETIFQFQMPWTSPDFPTTQLAIQNEIAKSDLISKTNMAFWIWWINCFDNEVREFCDRLEDEYKVC